MQWYQWLVLLLIPIAAYLCGSFSTAVVVSRCLFHEDIREHGSGNAGMTNVLRVYGKLPALYTLLGDLGKAAVAIVPAKFLLVAVGFPVKSLGYLIGGCLAALFVIVGHIKPVWFGFRGGKGVLTTVGVWMFIDWRSATLCFVAFLIVVAFTKYVSLGSIVGMACLPPLTVLFGVLDHNPYYFVMLVTACIIAFSSIFMHRANIVRLCKGTESKLGSHRKEKMADEISKPVTSSEPSKASEPSQSSENGGKTV